MQQLLPTQIHDETLYITLPEEFDSFKVDKVRDQLDSFVNTTNDAVCIDFQDTQFLDSSGIGAIVFLFKRLTSKNKELTLINVSGQPLKLMSMLHVDRAIPVNHAHQRQSA